MSKYSSRRADHTFPCPSHVGGTRGVKYPCTSCLEEVVICRSSTFMAWIPRSSVAPTKLVPRSELYRLTSPLIDMNLRSAFMNAEDDISAINSMWAARVVRHKNSTAHLFDWAHPPLVLRATMFQGPNTSNPTFVNGGPGSNLSFSKSDIY